MDLMERYLAAIRRELPAARADDIAAELRDDLLSRAEAREAALGRPLDRRETSALIKEFGHPLLVASRYRAHQYLIGPDSFPFYLFVMRIVVLIVAAVVVAVGIGNVLFGGQDWLHALGQTIGGLWMSALINAAIITIVFAVLDRAGFASEHVARWVPDHLPDVTDKQPGPWESAFEVALGIAFLLWWTGVIRFPLAVGASGFRVEPAPVIWTFYWPILIVAVARLVHNLVQWLRPRWAIVRTVLGGATAVGTIAIIVLLYRAGHWVSVVSTGMAIDEAADIERSVNLSLKIGLVATGAILTVATLGGLWKSLRKRAG